MNYIIPYSTNSTMRTLLNLCYTLTPFQVLFIEVERKCPPLFWSISSTSGGLCRQYLSNIEYWSYDSKHLWDNRVPKPMLSVLILAFFFPDCCYPSDWYWSLHLCLLKALPTTTQTKIPHMEMIYNNKFRCFWTHKTEMNYFLAYCKSMVTIKLIGFFCIFSK